MISRGLIYNRGIFRVDSLVVSGFLMTLEKVFWTLLWRYVFDLLEVLFQSYLRDIVNLWTKLWDVDLKNKAICEIIPQNCAACAKCQGSAFSWPRHSPILTTPQRHPSRRDNCLYHLSVTKCLKHPGKHYLFPLAETGLCQLLWVGKQPSLTNNPGDFAELCHHAWRIAGEEDLSLAEFGVWVKFLGMASTDEALWTFLGSNVGNCGRERAARDGRKEAGLGWL